MGYIYVKEKGRKKKAQHVSQDQFWLYRQALSTSQVELLEANLTLNLCLVWNYQNRIQTHSKIHLMTKNWILHDMSPLRLIIMIWVLHREIKLYVKCYFNNKKDIEVLFWPLIWVKVFHCLAKYHHFCVSEI